MALALQDGTFAWQTVFHTLATQNAGHAAVEAFKDLKDVLVGAKGNPQLQVIPFSAITTADPGICQDTGYSPIGAVTSLVYAFFAKNQNTGDGTDSYIRLYNATTNTSVSAALVSGLIQSANDEFFYIAQSGIRFATDLTISADTGAAAGTESAAANAAWGFVLVGA